MINLVNLGFLVTIGLYFHIFVYFKIDIQI
nr:MAG TPA: hypothetical protein [Caudoviricetes sp.]